MSDDDFEPKLGKTHGNDGKRSLKYLARVVVAARLATARTGVPNRRFDGSRIGRGASLGRLLSSRDRLASFRGRRVIVKTRLVRLGAKGIGTARAHLRYIQRDGVTREGHPGELYSADRDLADGKAFLERSDGDRHQFRFIVSAEDGAEYPDLKPYIRRLMTQVESDLGTKLDWLAVDHFNTERPHTHIMLRGKDDGGENLVIAREYIAHGFRERAAELVTLDLGPRTDREIQERLRHDVDQERLTAIDRRLLRKIDADRLVAATDPDPFQQSLATGRLRKLAAMGLAENVGGGRFRLIEEIEDVLRRLGERGDIIRTMQRELSARRLDRADRVIAAPAGPLEPVVGRVIHRGIADEYRDRHYLMVDGVDGQVHYLEIGRGDASPPTPEEAVVRVSGRDADIRLADRTVVAVAAANGGRYSIDNHLRFDPLASQGFAEAHVRRLEALRRAGAGVEREADGSWVIAADHLDGAAAYEQRQRRDRPVDVEILSTAPVAALARADAPTWLDRELASTSGTPIRDAGFGTDVRAALVVRRQWLVEQELADDDGGTVRLRANALDVLRRRELLRVAEGLENEIGKAFVEMRHGDRIEGRLARSVDLASGRYALIEKSREFTLVPWRPILQKQLGNEVSGTMRGDGVNWRFGRARSGPEIS